MFARKLTVLVASAATILATAVVIAPTADAKPKAKAPARVSKVRVSTVTNAASLSWKNPKSKNFKGTIVRIAAGTKAPKTIKSGRNIGKVSKKKHAVRVTRLAPNTLYTVSIFSSGGGKLASKPYAVRIRTKALPKPPAPKDTTPPGAVTGVVVTIVDGVARIMWTPPADADFNGVKILRTELARSLAAMRVRTARAVGDTVQVADLSKGQNSFDDKTIQAGRSYSYSVLSKDLSGNTSTPAQPAAGPAITKAPTDPVTNVEADGTDGNVALSWSLPDNVLRYAGAKIVRKAGSAASTSVDDGTPIYAADSDEVTYNDYDVDSGATYTYTVFAFNGDGIAAAGVSDTVTVESDEPDVVSISGKVTAKSNSTRLEGVTVDAFDEDGVEADTFGYTDVHGDYTINDLPDGKYTICFDALGVDEAPSTTGYLSQCADDVDWMPSSAPADGATPRTVTAGTTAPVVDAALEAGTALTGTVSSGAALVAEAVVYAYDGSDDSFVSSTDSNGDGTYRLVGLPAGDYKVCVDGSGATGGTAQAGFLGACNPDVAWDPLVDDGPTSTDTVSSLSPDAVDFDLDVASGFTGTVETVGGEPVSGASVTAFDSAGVSHSVQTDSDGTYRFTGLQAGDDNTVCASAEYAADLPTGGYSPLCFVDAPWDNGSDPAPDAQTFSLSKGALVGGKDVALPRGGEIRGSVHAAAAPHGSLDANVVVFEAGAQVASASTLDGSYTATGLRPGTDYAVCFQPFGSDDNGHAYVGQCYDKVAWDGASTPASGSEPVTVSAGQPTSSIDAELVAAATINGVVSSDGEPVDTAIYVYDASGNLQTAETEFDDDGDSTGVYSIDGLAPGAYKVCFRPLDGSYQSECYDNVPWDGPDGANPSPTGPSITLGDGDERTVSAELSLAG